MRFFKLSVLCLVFITANCQAYDFKLALLHGNEAVFSYELSVLRLALANADGQHTLSVVPVKDTPQARILQLLRDGTGPFNIFFTGFSKKREDFLLQVDFPISRGLLGHRIFIIHQDNQQTMAAISSIEEMTQDISIGSGIGWPDSAIFKHHGFKVHESQYSHLWNMLERKRFIAFNRGVHEAYTEIEQHRQNHRYLKVDSALMVVYPFDYFFYLSPKTPALAQVIQLGLRRAFDNGRFMENFNSHPQIKSMLTLLRPQNRTIFHLDNPLLSDRVKNLPKEYWLHLK
mgnify:CR=1 FL=1